MPHQGVKDVTPDNLNALKSIWEINQANPSRIQNHPMRESLLEKVSLYDTYLGLVGEEENQVIQEQTLEGPGQGDELAGIDQPEQFDDDVISSAKSRIDSLMADEFGGEVPETPGGSGLLQPGSGLINKAITGFSEALAERNLAEIQGAENKLDVWDRIKQTIDNPVELLPFISGIQDVNEIAHLALAINRFEKDEETPQDVKLLMDFYDRQEEDVTFGFKVADIILMLPAFAGELFLTSGLFTAGKKAATELAEKGIKKLFTKSAKKILENKAAQLGIKVGAGIAGGTLQAPVAGAFRITEGTIQNMMPEVELTENERGQVELMVTEQGDDLVPALTRAFGDNWIEVVSEHSGGLFGRLGAGAKTMALRHGILKGFLKSNPGMRPSDFRKILDKLGWNGVINEMLEERVGEVGRTVILGDEFHIPDKDQLFVELVAFSIPGVTLAGAQQLFDNAQNTKEKEVFGTFRDDLQAIIDSNESERLKEERLKSVVGDLIRNAERANVTVPGFESEREGPTAENVLQFSEEELRQEIFALDFSDEAYLALTEEERRNIVTQQIKPTDEQRRPELRTPQEIAAGARFVIPAPEQLESELPSEEESNAAAEELGVTFNGVMGEDIEGATPLLLFTDPETKSTIAVKKLDELKDKLEVSRETFKKASKPPVTEKVVEEPTEEVETIPEEAEVAETEEEEPISKEIVEEEAPKKTIDEDIEARKQGEILTDLLQEKESLNLTDERDLELDREIKEIPLSERETIKIDFPGVKGRISGKVEIAVRADGKFVEGSDVSLTNAGVGVGVSNFGQAFNTRVEAINAGFDRIAEKLKQEVRRDDSVASDASRRQAEKGLVRVEEIRTQTLLGLKTEEEDVETRPSQEEAEVEPTEEVVTEEIDETQQTTEEVETPPEKIEVSETLVLLNVPVSQIKTDVDLFQNRDAELSQASVDSILRAVEIRDEVAEGDPLPDDAFRIEVFDPILLWRSPETGELFVLQGHSRVEAFRQLAALGKKEFEKIPSKVLENITVEQASRIGKTSNFNQAAEEIIEQAKFFRAEIEKGVTKKQLKKDAVIKTGANSARVLAIARLNPKGKMLDVLRALTANTDTDATDALNMATWIGKLRDRWPDLTNTHENEIFDELFPNYKTTLAYQNFDNFSARVQTYVDRHMTLGVFDGEPLNFKNIKVVAGAELALQERLKDKEKEVAAAERKQKAERGKIKDKIAKLREDGKTEKADELQKELDILIPKLEEQIQLLQSELSKLKFDFDIGISDIRRGQAGLFDDRVYDNETLLDPTDVKKFDMNPEDIQNISAVSLFQAIRELGVNPKLNRLLRTTLGRFIPDPVFGAGIEFKPAIFRDEEGAIRTLAHEFGHLVDYLDDKTLTGNGLGKLLVIKDLRKEIIAGDDVSESSFNDYLKERNRLLSNITRLQRRQKGGAEVFNIRVKGEKTVQIPIQDRIDELTDKLKDLEKNLHLNKDIREELWKVSQVMRPVDLNQVSDAHRAYRLSAVEMYADFVSAIFLQADVAAGMAPKSWKLWHDNLKKKPKFKKKYDELQALIRGDEITYIERSYRELYTMIGEDSEAAALELEKIRQKQDFSFWANMKGVLLDKNWSIIKEDRKLVNDGKFDVEESLYEAFDRFPTENAGLAFKLFDDFHEMRKEWLHKGIDDVDIGVFMFLSRAATGREDVANPKFYTKNESLKSIAGLKRFLGTEKFNEVEKYTNLFNDWWNTEVLKPAVESGWISEEMFVTLNNGFAIKQKLMTEEKAATLDKNLKAANVGNVTLVEDVEDSNLKRVTWTEQVTYAPFIPQHHFKNSGIGAGIFKQIGTLSDIMNPLYAGLLKAMAMRRAVLHNRLRRDFGNHAIKNFPDVNEWKEGNPRPAPGRDTISFRDEGKPKWFEAPKVFTDAFDRSKSKFQKLVTKMLGLPNNFFRAMVVVYAVGFIVKNIFFRDVKRTARGLNLGRQKWWSPIPFSKTITRFQLTFMYLPHKEGRKLWNAAFSKSRMKPNDYMKGLLKKDFLQPNLSTYILHGNSLMEQEEGNINSIEAFLDRMGLVEAPKQFKNKWIDWALNNKLGKTLYSSLDALRTFSDAGEAMGKLVPYEFALANNLVGTHKDAIWKNEQELLDWIRDFAGTPNFMKKGHYAGSLNQIGLFFNITTQGFLAFGRQMITGRVPGKFSKTRAWFQYLENIAFPLMVATTGYYAFQAFGDDDDEEETFPLADDSKAWAVWMGKAYNMIGNYDKSNFLTFPIGYIGYDGKINLMGEFDPRELDNVKKVVYFRAPMADEQRWIHGVMWYTIQAALRDNADLSDLAQIFNYSLEQTPSIAPVINMFYTLGKFATGQNPVDDFFNQEIIDKDAFKVKHPDMYWQMAEWTASRMGVPEIAKLKRSFIDKSAETEKIFEKLIRVMPIARDFIKISNRGAYEFFESATRELEREKILDRMDDEDFIDDWTAKYLKTFNENKQTPELSRALEDFADIFMGSIQERLAEIPADDDSGEELEGLTEEDYKRSFNRLIRSFWRQTGKAVYNTHMSSLATRQSNVAKEEILQQLLPLDAAREMQKQFPEEVSSSMGAMSMPVDDYIELLTIAKISGYINQELTYNYIELADKFGR